MAGMPSRAETSERIGGAAFLSIPAFDAFVSVLDNYGRIDLLLNLRSQLPPFLFNPVTVFVCLCIGLGLLYRSSARQLKRLAESAQHSLVDTSGVAISTREKPKWLIPVLVIFAFVLLATPILAITYSVRSEGPTPHSPELPSPPFFAYLKTPPKPMVQPPKPQIVAIAPNGIANAAPNSGTQSVMNNFERPYRHLTDDQKTKLQSLVDSLPADSGFVHIEMVNDPETIKYGNEIAALFKPKTGGSSVGLSYPQGTPEGVYVAVSSPQDQRFSLAQQIASAFLSAQIPVVFCKADKPPGEILILIGVRPEH